MSSQFGPPVPPVNQFGPPPAPVNQFGPPAPITTTFPPPVRVHQIDGGYGPGGNPPTPFPGGGVQEGLPPQPLGPINIHDILSAILAAAGHPNPAGAIAAAGGHPNPAASVAAAAGQAGTGQDLHALNTVNHANMLAALNAAFAAHNQALYHSLRMQDEQRGFHPAAYSTREQHVPAHPGRVGGRGGSVV